MERTTDQERIDPTLSNDGTEIVASVQGLAEVRPQWDPENLLRMDRSVAPAA